MGPFIWSMNGTCMSMAGSHWPIVRDQGHCYVPYVGLFVELETSNFV